MSLLDASPRPSDRNPFSTRYVRPGAIEYLFPSSEDAAQLVARLESNGWRGQIIGPHGSGKSTLLATLAPLLEQAGRSLILVTLREGQRRFPFTGAQSQAWNSATQIVVDGYEQLGWWSRRWLDATCRRRGAGLLVTAHESVGLPPLVSISPSLASLQAIVARLLPAECRLVTPDDVARCHQQQAGNARETLFALYDLYESRRRA